LTEEEEYQNNPFSVSLLYCTQKAMESMMAKEEFKIGQNNFHLLNASEKYVSRISEINGDLNRVFEQINTIRIFIRRFPNRKFYYENGIGELDYIQYHTECLIHKVHTILEIMKLLVNEVYCLKIPKKDCNWKNITSKLSKKTACLQIISLYFKVFDSFIESRHINTHRGKYNDSEKNNIEMDYGLDLYQISYNLNYDLGEDFRKKFPKSMIDLKIKELKKNRIKLINETEKNINDLLKAFMTSLLDEFKKKTKTFYNNASH